MKSLGNSFKYHVYPHVYENDENQSSLRRRNRQTRLVEDIGVLAAISLKPIGRTRRQIGRLSRSEIVAAHQSLFRLRKSGMLSAPELVP
jgi:hypothetical protein